MRGANLVGVFVGGFVVWLFLWISKFCWSAGGGAEVRHWCKPGVVSGVRLEVIKVQVHVATLPTCAPLLILPPPFAPVGTPKRQWLCSHLAHL